MGTGTITVPIATSPARSGFGPQLALSYDSGAGNGPFGFGWSLSLPAIARKTDKGLPQYRDAAESDVYVFAGAEDLVPVLQPDGTRCEDGTTAPGYVIHRYRPRVEGLFARIERCTNVTTGDIHWRSISRDNVTSLYRTDGNSRVSDASPSCPGDAPRVFSWLIRKSYDDKGNAIIYVWAAENADNVDLALSSERNRMRTANRYLEWIRYGNRQANRDPDTWMPTDPFSFPQTCGCSKLSSTMRKLTARRSTSAPRSPRCGSMNTYWHHLRSGAGGPCAPTGVRLEPVVFWPAGSVSDLGGRVPGCRYGSLLASGCAGNHVA